MGDRMIHPLYGLLSPFVLEVRRKVAAGAYPKDVPSRPGPKRKPVTSRCKRCGDEFAPRNSQHVYCDKQCARQVARDKWRARQVTAPAQCRWCNRTFSPRDYRTKFCSPACRRAGTARTIQERKQKEANDASTV